MSKSRIDWKNHLIEFVFITLGVILAFSLNTWNENRKESDQADLYLQGLMAELSANRRQLEKTYPYHLDLIRRLSEEPGKTSLELKGGFFNNVAWTSADHAVLKSHLDFELYTLLASTYGLHEMLKHHINMASDRIHELNVMSPLYLLSGDNTQMTDEDWALLLEQSKMGWVPVFQDWVNIEHSYLRQIIKVQAYHTGPERYQMVTDSIAAATDSVSAISDSIRAANAQTP